MKVRVGGEARSGRAINIRDATELHPTAVARAVRGEDTDGVSVACPDPCSVHEHVGAIRPGMAFSVRPALAAAARSRGRAAPQDDELADLRERVDALAPPEIDLADARRRVAETGDEEARLRERVASLRGRVRALREADPKPDAGDPTLADAEADLSDATRRLAEVETERIAAEQALDQARERARSSRADRRERLRLRDRADNLRRSAREHLAESVRDAFDDALAAVPGDSPSPADPADDPVAAALAVARVADLDAPVVLARGVGRFRSAERAVRWLDAPVVRL